MHNLPLDLDRSSEHTPFCEVKTVKLAPGVRLESINGAGAVIFHESTGARMQISTRAHSLLVMLRLPASVSALLEASARVGRILSNLYDRGFLVDADLPPSQCPRRSVMPSAHTLFHCARAAVGRIEEGSVDVVALGVPFDLGSIVVGGQRQGPSALRIASNQFIYETALDDGRPLGWYDINLGMRILEGVRIVDAGDFCFEYGEAVESVYNRLGLVWESLYRSGAMPVAIGGDHSITYPLVERLQQHGGITLVWFDAHTDQSFYRAEQSHHYGNVLTRLLDLKGVERVVRVGARGAVSMRDNLDSDRVQTISANKLQRLGPSLLRQAIAPGSHAYVSIDLDVLDPSVAPAVGTPVPGGLSLRELEGAIAVTALSARIAAMDLVELNPALAPGQATACVASLVLLSALHAATAARKAGKQEQLASEKAALVQAVKTVCL